MIVDFLKDIYEKALAVELLKETSYYSNLICSETRRDLWNEASIYLDNILNDLRNSDVNRYQNLMKSLIKARDSFKDSLEFGSIIDVEIIPQILDYMQAYTGIEISEGDWTLKSSFTGCLTLRDRNNMFVHSPSDPLWESFLYARNLYDPEIRRYNILSAGLGYLAYQLWRISGGEADIYIYELDKDVSEYSDLYGMVSFIDQEKLHYVYDDDKDRVIEQFLQGVEVDKKSTIYYWDKMMYSGKYSDYVKALRSSEVTNRVYRDVQLRNYSWNKSFDHFLISDLDKSLYKKEWIIAASGPSLNSNEDFIAQSIGNKIICAVNSSLKWFSLHSIKPDFCTVCDPTDELVNHIEGLEQFSESIPLIAYETANYKYIRKYKGPKYYVVSNVKPEEQKQVDRWDFGGTVTSFALAAAYKFGATKIYLVGADLSYPDGDMYADGVGHEAEKWLKQEEMTLSVEDTVIPTSNIFSEYKVKIESQIAAKPEIEVVNKSHNGAYIKGTYCGQWWENLPVGNAIREYIDIFGNLTKSSFILGWEEKYYILWQLLHRMEEKRVEANNELNDAIYKAYRSIYDSFKEKLTDSFQLNGKVNKSQTYIIVNEYWDGDSESQRLLEIAKNEYDKKQSVLIVNTTEKLSGNKIPIHGVFEKKYNSAMEKSDKIYYKNRVFSYFQFSEGMPNIAYYSVFMDSIAQNTPGKIIALSKYSILTDLCRDLLNMDVQQI